jgi:hypothetical protein
MRDRPNGSNNSDDNPAPPHDELHARHARLDARQRLGHRRRDALQLVAPAAGKQRHRWRVGSRPCSRSSDVARLCDTGEIDQRMPDELRRHTRIR